MAEQIVVGDTLTDPEFVITDPETGAAVDLTGLTVEAKYRIGVAALKTKSCTVVGLSTGGRVRFTTRAAGDFDAAGVARGRLYFGGAGGTIGKQPLQFMIEVAPATEDV